MTRCSGKSPFKRFALIDSKPDYEIPLSTLAESLAVAGVTLAFAASGSGVVGKIVSGVIGGVSMFILWESCNLSERMDGSEWGHYSLTMRDAGLHVEPGEPTRAQLMKEYLARKASSHVRVNDETM